ncbi:transglutaminase family protein [Rhodocytophaga rosea]|uniref:Transglutaminase family protein n=1 Tax=Rhodocytophaga rosea TaxID=2704465 RepID=A0A6C0GJ69_9BACT|nr:transglutaminase family protein [Rhodocytophaga rosea]QHT68111.1 transglutaminase family protein [Rhodocytophaga rosea]
MKFEIASELAYEIHSPTTLLINIHALRSPGQTIIEETFNIEPYIRIEELTSIHYENRFIRLEVEEGTNLNISYKAIVDASHKIIDQRELEAVPVVALDGNVIPFLFPSRYCQSDKLSTLAYKEFGHISNVYEKVLAIVDWIYENVDYVSGSTNSQTSAYDTITERTGVCRDFAHLGIALCRALTIPARYFTGYSYKLNPPDFHACFEAYIGGQWLIFDATRLAPLNGLVKIANGRDAADASIASIFGRYTSNGITVSCRALDDNFVPFTHENAYHKAIAVNAI